MKAFECKQCGDCCRGEGGILVDPIDTGNIASFLGVAPDYFLKWYCERRNGKAYVKTRRDGYCVFFHPSRLCLIHPVKPRPCRLWPFYPALLRDRGAWEAAKDACPGISPDCAYEEFVKQGERGWKEGSLE